MKKTKKRITKIMMHFVLLFLALFQLFPLFVLFLNSLRADVEIKKFPIGLPETPSLVNYVETWIKGGYAVAFRNSILEIGRAHV